MPNGKLEHVNFTVPDPQKKADWLCDLFGWHVRWSGEAIHGGFTVHVGTDEDYLAIYSGPKRDPQRGTVDSYNQIAGLNHIGVVVDDLEKTEEKVRALGFEPHSHADYEPGRRFYFHDDDGIEFEVITYD